MRRPSRSRDNSTTNGPHLLNLSAGTNIEEPCDLDIAALEGELTAGSTFTDADAGISFSNYGVQGGHLIIGVNTPLNQLPKVDRVPIIDVISPERGVTESGDVTYEATAYDPDPKDAITGVNFYIVPKGIDPCLTELTSVPPQPPAIPTCVIMQGEGRTRPGYDHLSMDAIHGSGG